MFFFNFSTSKSCIDNLIKTEGICDDQLQTRTNLECKYYSLPLFLCLI